MRFLVLAVFLWGGCQFLEAADPAATGAQAPLDYRLDNGNGNFGLYPGAGLRSYIKEEEVVHSLADLESRIEKLPGGSRLYWQPFERDSSGEPVLFAEHEYGKLQRFCAGHGVKLAVSDAPPAMWSTIDATGRVKLLLGVDKATVSTGETLRVSLCFKTASNKSVTVHYFTPYLMEPEFRNQKDGMPARVAIPPLDVEQTQRIFVLNPNERYGLAVFILRINKPGSKASKWQENPSPFNFGAGFLREGAYTVSIRPRLEMVDGVPEPNIGLLTQTFMVRAPVEGHKAR